MLQADQTIVLNQYPGYIAFEELEPGYSSALFDTQFDTQSYLHWLPMAYLSEQSSLLPGAYFHVALEQVAGDDEMLDFIQQRTTSLDKWLAIYSSVRNITQSSAKCNSKSDSKTGQHKVCPVPFPMVCLLDNKVSSLDLDFFSLPYSPS